MGLDMYLYKRSDVKNCSFHRLKEKYSIEVKRGGKAVSDIKPEYITYITETIGVWRKASQIHSWIVDKFNDGIDDRKPIYLSEDNLNELLVLCLKVKSLLEEDNTAEVKKLLPPALGFFFGSYEIDDWYKEDIELTIDIFNEALSPENKE